MSWLFLTRRARSRFGEFFHAGFRELFKAMPAFRSLKTSVPYDTLAATIAVTTPARNQVASTVARKNCARAEKRCSNRFLKLHPESLSRTSFRFCSFLFPILRRRGRLE